jgi:signal peptidase II
VDPHAEDPARIEGRTRWLLLGGVATAVFVVDLLTKWWAVVALVDDRDIDIVWTLRFKLVHNTGSAFSLAEGRGVFLSVAALGAVAILLVTGRRTGRLWSLVAIGLIIGGALGNLADRAFRAGEGFMGGGVVDFIDLQWWPVFNIADMGVVIGAGLLIVTTGNAESRSAR